MRCPLLDAGTHALFSDCRWYLHHQGNPDYFVWNLIVLHRVLAPPADGSPFVHESYLAELRPPAFSKWLAENAAAVPKTVLGLKDICESALDT